VEVGSGPALIFITLPNIFNNMPLGRVWGALFFVFMTFAAFSSVLAVFENIIAMTRELTGWDRKKTCLVSAVLMFVLSLPCALGFNVLSGIQPLGEGTGIMDLEDFIVSNLMLPIGALIYVLFCTRRAGWGFENFLAEANMGKGLKISRSLRLYLTWGLPILIAAIIIMGLI